MKLHKLKNKKILILGFGEEGRATHSFLIHHGIPVAGIADRDDHIKAPEKIMFHTGDKYLQAISQYDIIIRSPGIPHHLVSPLLSPTQTLTSATNIFFEECSAPIIGVTGTKGKSTTCSLLAAIFKKSGKTAHIVGNIGTPALSLLKTIQPQDIVVYELSSFQLIDLSKGPHIAIFLNIFPDHLDHHQTYEEYIKAKARITKLQGPKDIFLYNSADTEASRIAKESPAKAIPFKPGTSLVKVTWAAPIEPVLQIAEIFSIPMSVIEEVIQTFKPPEHRLEVVGTWNNIMFINDSAATTPESTIRALDILEGSIGTLILGGSSKGVSYRALAQRILRSSVKHLIFFNPTGREIEEELVKIGKGGLSCNYASSMEEAVRMCYEFTPKEMTCLMSPASASFSMFSNYKERGHVFKDLVQKHAKIL
ncbi:MAG: UDP-N-acetylmuramoyl-L-alanine--D-glutamate ligase [bacterium]|nr:UDP-N-acetylmuramoyl-L-alanine--D-glutamate ligase [bacterium]